MSFKLNQKSRADLKQSPPLSPIPLKKLIWGNLLFLLLIFALFEIFLRLNSKYDYLISNKNITHGFEVNLNSSGFRDEEFDALIKKNENQFVVFVAGASITFGPGVEWDHVFAKRLQDLLNLKPSNQTFVVINGGGQGYDANQITNLIDKIELSIQPNLVVVVLSPPVVSREFRNNLLKKNSNSQMEGAEKNRGKMKLKFTEKLLQAHVWMYSNLRCYAFLQQEVRPFLYRKKIIREPLDKLTGSIMAYAFDADGIDGNLFNRIQHTYSLIGDNIRKLNEKLKTIGSGLLVMGVPSRFMISDLPEDNLRNIDKKKIRIDPMEKIKSLLQKNRIPYADLKHRFVREREQMISGKIKWNDLYNRNDYAHLNDRGHEIASEVLLSAINASNFLVQK
jgi:lysophospholipase L1-like esterase